MSSKVRVQLMIMMFLEFFLWGCWYATMGTYMGAIGFSDLDIGSAYTTISLGAIVSPFFVGMIADRYFSAEKVKAIIHIFGAGVLYALSTILDPSLFFWVLLLYTVMFMPTIALANAISFNQMDSPEKEFPIIRVLGTIGWIVAGLILGFGELEDSHLQFQMAAGCSVLLGVYSFFLPSSPPKNNEAKPTVSDILGLDALELFKNRNFSIFVICSILISIPLSFYFAYANIFLNEIGVENAASKMTMGQVSEILFMLIIPLLFVRLGVKKMLLIGMLAWVLRYFLFAYGNSQELVWMLYMGIILHGICYDFFFVTGQIYVDNAAPKKIQASAQGMITLATYGIGMGIGSYASGIVAHHYKTGENQHVWEMIWMVPAVMAVVSLIAFFIFFKDDNRTTA